MVGKSPVTFFWCFGFTLALSVFINSVTMALLADSDASTFVDISIFSGEFMAVFAVGLSRAICEGANPAINDINAMRDGLKMCWIDTQRVSAEMINVKSFRNRTNEQFIRDTVRWPDFSVFEHVSVPVASLHGIVERRRPNPARLSFLNLQQKALFQSARHIAC